MTSSADMTRIAIGIDIGGTKTAGVLVGDDGELLAEPVVTPTPAKSGAGAILRTATRVAAELIAQSPSPVEAVGVGTAGVIDKDGTVASATDLLSGWAGTPVAQEMAAELGLPVSVLNDVHAAGVGEALAGSGVGHRRVLVVAVGTGIGGALLRDGILDIGPAGISGSVGHIPVSRKDTRRCSCGGLGHVEAFSSGPAMEAIYAERTGEKLDLRKIEERARTGDKIANGVITEGAQALGEALAAAANLLDPDCIVLGGGVANLGDLLVDPAQQTYRSLVLPTARNVPIVRAELGTNAAMVGAALAALSSQTRALPPSDDDRNTDWRLVSRNSVPSA